MTAFGANETTDFDYSHIVFYIWCVYMYSIFLEALRRGGGWVKLTRPLDFFGFKFLLFDQLSKGLLLITLSTLKDKLNDTIRYIKP